MDTILKKILVTVVFIQVSVLIFPAYALESITFYHSDAVGTPLAMSNEDGSLAWEAVYLPFGEEYSSGPITDNNRRFVGKEKDAESGLGYFGARYLAVEEGRFFAVEPVRSSSESGELNSVVLTDPRRQNLYAYSLNNPYRYYDPDGNVVIVVASDPKEAKILQEAYSRMNRTKRGMAISSQLEKSKDVYKIKPIDKDAFYCSSAAACPGNDKTVFIDPNNNVLLPTKNGMEEASKAAVLAHELGHAVGDRDDGPNRMNNVNKNENPVREGLGEPKRTNYSVPSIKWVPGKK